MGNSTTKTAVVPPRPPSKPKLSTKSKLEIDVVNINSLNSGAAVKAYYKRVIKFLTGGSQQKFIKWCDNNKVDVKDYVVFVKFELDGEKVTLLIRGNNIYLGGFMLENGDCYLIDKSLSKFVSFEKLRPFGTSEDAPVSMLKPPSKNDKLTLCLQKLGMKNLYTLPIGDSYKALEKAAGLKREEIFVGEKELKEAFKDLSSYNKSNESDEEFKKVAKGLLFFTQFLCEAVRVVPHASTVIGAFEYGEGAKIPKWVLLLHHAWGFASCYMRRVRENKKLDGFTLRFEESSPNIDASDMDDYFSTYVEGSCKCKKTIILKTVFDKIHHEI